MKKIIIQKFLAWDPDCKDWSFEEADGVVEITLPILDAHNDYVQLYCSIAQTNGEAVMFLITDDGFIEEEYDYKGKTSIFTSPLRYSCRLEDFNESMDYYFDALRCAGIPIGFTKLLDRKAIEKIDNEYAELEKIFQNSPIKKYLGKNIKNVS